MWGCGQVGAKLCAGTKGMAVKRNQNCAELSEGLRVLSVMVSPPALAQLVPFGSCRLLLPALSLWELQGALPPLLLQCLQPEV